MKLLMEFRNVQHTTPQDQLILVLSNVYVYLLVTFGFRLFSHIFRQMNIILSPTNMEYLYVMLHDRDHFVPSNLRIFGSDILDISLGKANYYSYAIYPTKTTFIDMENERCLTRKEIKDQNMWQCLEGYLDSKMNCSLPWRQKKVSTNKALCSHPWEYDQYYEYMDHLIKYGPSSIKNVTKCIPACMRYDYSTKIHKQLNNWEVRSGTVQIDFFYIQYEVPVREHVIAYDIWNLISDFGGYLGLLLGYSILAFYDTSVFIIGKVMGTILPLRTPSHMMNDH